MGSLHTSFHGEAWVALESLIVDVAVVVLVVCAAVSIVLKFRLNRQLRAYRDALKDAVATINKLGGGPGAKVRAPIGRRVDRVPRAASAGRIPDSRHAGGRCVRAGARSQPRDVRESARKLPVASRDETVFPL